MTNFPRPARWMSAIYLVTIYSYLINSGANNMINVLRFDFIYNVFAF